MKRIYLFDIDGTLTPARQRMTSEFMAKFTPWVRENTVYLVTGSDHPKALEQLPEQTYQAVNGVFTCAGAELWENGERTLANDHEFPAELYALFQDILDDSAFPIRTGNHIEKRTGMLNVSIVGRNADTSTRYNYRDWDAGVKEREYIVSKLRRAFPQYDYAIGGDISIDITPTGMDKAQILPVLKERHRLALFSFYGDRIRPGGNDEPLANALRVNQCNKVHPVRSYVDTAVHLFGPGAIQEAA